jgi:hypothetical protein
MRARTKREKKGGRAKEYPEGVRDGSSLSFAWSELGHEERHIGHRVGIERMEDPVTGEFFDVSLLFDFVVQFDQTGLASVELVNIALLDNETAERELVASLPITLAQEGAYILQGKTCVLLVNLDCEAVLDVLYLFAFKIECERGDSTGQRSLQEEREAVLYSEVLSNGLELIASVDVVWFLRVFVQ